MDPKSPPSSRPPACHGRLGPYRICLEVASGGMATVYLARSDARVGPDRFVALKVAHPHLARDATFVEMFADEARLASRIHHPNVCRVLDFDPEGAEPYLAMEYLDGENLASVFGRFAERLETCAYPPLDLERHAALVARVMADVCAGLHAAHELRDDDGARLDVVHRDVSPENIFVTFDGAVKVVDFGVAQAARQHHRTSTGFVKGKIAYLQPEALAGSTIDRRADVWGAGVTTWELLTGKRLFRREGELETIRAIGEEPIPRPSEVRPGLPPALDAVVAKALARDPDERHATARDLGRELLAALGAERPAPDMVDLAEWMDTLFPGGRERGRRLREVAERIADDWALSEDREDARDRERTRRRPFLPPPPLPSIPSPWSSMPPPRASRRGRALVALALVVGASAGALGGWYASRRAGFASAAISPEGGGAGAAPIPAASYRPTAELLREQAPQRSIPLGLARMWEDAEGAKDAARQYSFEIGDDTEEVVLRFRRARRGGGEATPPP